MGRKRHNESVKKNGSKQQIRATQVTREHLLAAMDRAVEKVQKMSHRELVQSLKDTGILTPTGKLAAIYR